MEYIKALSLSSFFTININIAKPCLKKVKRCWFILPLGPRCHRLFKINILRNTKSKSISFNLCLFEQLFKTIWDVLNANKHFLNNALLNLIGNQLSYKCIVFCSNFLTEKYKPLTIKILHSSCNLCCKHNLIYL